MEILTKLAGAGVIVARSVGDAGWMLWQSLDNRERLILLYGALVVIVVVAGALKDDHEQEERIARRAAELLTREVAGA